MSEDITKYFSQIPSLLEVPGLPKMATQIPEMSSIQNQIMSKLKSGQSSTTILSSSPTVAQDAFENSNNSFVDSKIIDNSKTGNFSPDLPGNLNQFSTSINSAMQSFQGGSQNLKSTGLTFIASTTDKSIDGIDLPSGMNSITDAVGLGIGQLGKLSALGGDVLSSSKDALKAVTGGLQDAMSVGKEAMSAVQSGLADFSKYVIAPIKDLTTIASTLTNPRMISGLVSSNLDFLPPQMAGMVGYQAGYAFNNATGGFGQKVNDISRNVYALDSLLGNFSGSSQNINQYNPYDPYGQSGYGYGGYPTLSGMNGEYIPGYSSYNGSASDFNQMASAINQLCGNQNYPLYQDFNAKKTAYDLLMMLAMQSGAGGLVQALMNCTGGAGYNDSRTSMMMYGMSQNVGYSGDPYTYRMMLESAGPGYMQRPNDGLLGLLSNSSYNDQNAKDIIWAMNQHGVNSSDLLAGPQAGRYPTYDSSRMTVMQQGDRRYYSQYAPQQDYSAVNVAVSLFSSLFN